MKIGTIIIAVMAFAAALTPYQAPAQEASPTSTPTETAAPAPAPAAPRLYYLEVDANDLQAISNGINELPKRIADPLVLKLNAQLKAQDQITAAKAKAEEPKKGKK